MGSLCPDDIEAIAGAVKTAIEQKHAEFWIEAEQHFLDHQQLAECRQLKGEWLKNHEFTAELRKNTNTAKRIILKTTIGGIVTAIIAWIVYHATTPN